MTHVIFNGENAVNVSHNFGTRPDFCDYNCNDHFRVVEEEENPLGGTLTGAGGVCCNRADAGRIRLTIRTD